MNAHPECYGAMFPNFTRLKCKEKLDTELTREGGLASVQEIGRLTGS